MKKKIVALVLALLMVCALAGCDESDRVSNNISQQANNFNVLSVKLHPASTRNILSI